eukprot:1946285-Rhodomonas_salina.1
MSMSNYEKGKFLSKGAFGSLLDQQDAIPITDEALALVFFNVLTRDAHESGRVSQAFLAKCKRTQKDYVVKMVEIEKLSRKERDAARKECGILGSLKHPNIIEYRESFEDGGHLCIVMAFAEGGDMTGVLKAQRGKLLEEDTIMDWFVQICLGMKHVHDRKILHRDLKSQNIFLSNKKRIIKLGDFGIAKVLKHTMEVAKTAIGTPYYLSPEICEGKSYNNKSDIWSLGIVLYELCTLRCPFDASNLNGLVSSLCTYAYLHTRACTDLAVWPARSCRRQLVLRCRMLSHAVSSCLKLVLTVQPAATRCSRSSAECTRRSLRTSHRRSAHVYAATAFIHAETASLSRLPPCVSVPSMVTSALRLTSGAAQLKGLVGLLLSKDPRARPNINQILSMPIMTARMGKVGP